LAGRNLCLPLLLINKHQSPKTKEPSGRVLRQRFCPVTRLLQSGEDPIFGKMGSG